MQKKAMECSKSVTNETLASGGVDCGDMSAITESRIEDLNRQIKEMDNAANQIRAQWGSPSNPSIITGNATEAGIGGSPNKFKYYVTPEGRLMRIPKVENPELTPFTKSPIKGKGEEKEEGIKIKRKNKDQKHENSKERRSKGKGSKDPSYKTDQKGSKEPSKFYRTRSSHKEQKEDENPTECRVTLKNSVVRGVDRSALPANEKKGSDYKIKPCFNAAEQINPSVIKKYVKEEERPSRSISKTEKDESVHRLRDNSLRNVTKIPCFKQKPRQLFPNGKNQDKGLPKQSSSKDKEKVDLQSGITIIDNKIPVLQLTRVVVIKAVETIDLESGLTIFDGKIPVIRLTRVETQATVATKAPVKRKREAKEEETQKKRKCGDTKIQQHKDTKRKGLLKRRCLNKKVRTDSRNEILIDAKKSVPPSFTFPSSLNMKMEKKKVQAPQLLPSKPSSETKISSKRKREEKEEIEKKRKSRDNKDQQRQDTKTRKQRSKGKDSKVPSDKVDKEDSKEPSISHSRRLTRKQQKKPDDSKNSSLSIGDGIGDVKRSPSLSAPKTIKCVRRAPRPPTKRQPPELIIHPAQSADPLSGIFAKFLTPNQSLLPNVYDPR